MTFLIVLAASEIFSCIYCDQSTLSIYGGSYGGS